VDISTLLENVMSEQENPKPVYSERVNSRSLYAIARPSVVCLSSVTLVSPTQPVEIFRNISTAFGTLAAAMKSFVIVSLQSDKSLVIQL